jgi:hypothetical protein
MITYSLYNNLIKGNLYNFIPDFTKIQTTKKVIKKAFSGYLINLKKDIQDFTKNNNVVKKNVCYLVSNDLSNMMLSTLDRVIPHNYKRISLGIFLIISKTLKRDCAKLSLTNIDNDFVYFTVTDNKSNLISYRLRLYTND